MKDSKSSQKKGAKKDFITGLKNETKQGIFAIMFFVIAILFSLAPLQKAGVVGEKTYTIFSYLLGIGYFLIPILFLMLSISFLLNEERVLNKLKITGGILFFISSLGIIDAISRTYFVVAKGGLLGKFISLPLLKLFGLSATLVILIAVLIISILVLFETKFTIDTIFFWRRWKKNRDEDEDENEEEIEDEDNLKEKVKDAEKRRDKEIEKEEKENESLKKKVQKAINIKKGDEEEDFKISNRASIIGTYAPPPLDLLSTDKGKPGVGDIKANANIIKRTLQNFGIDVEMDEISVGPSVTRYALKPAEGIKVARILGLQNDLSLALAAHPLRIEAPIPGKSLVGIEIPNTIKSMVGLGSLVGSEEFQNSEKPLLVSLGKGISGKLHFSNLAKMPHLLIAGATGSGKSVTIHTIITSLLYRNSPQDLKFIMIDPKRVELTLYNKIPHLLTPVITNAKKTILALKWAAKEMDRRYDVLEGKAVKDIDSYHKNILAPELKKINELQENKKFNPEIHKIPETMPYIVVVVDELADIMMSYPRELESAIVRLAQMSRAVGIHLILSTQRPSVNVITGLIKANIPARIALQVVSQIDSRTILDTMGAEKLLGAGDMLYLGGEMSKPVRIQSAFVTENEVKAVTKYLSTTYQDELPEIISLTETANEKGDIFDATIEDDEDEDDDTLYEEAKDIVQKAGKGSTSYLQRKLRVGYARAARLMDMLEERGVIGPADGARPREVIGAVGTTDTDIDVDAENVEKIDDKEENPSDLEKLL
ncbi:MAG: DNA translocase FtsK 4TM domain-containing protein [Minisyncoccia bacterium]